MVFQAVALLANAVIISFLAWIYFPGAEGELDLLQDPLGVHNQSWRAYFRDRVDDMLYEEYWNVKMSMYGETYGWIRLGDLAILDAGDIPMIPEEFSPPTPTHHHHTMGDAKEFTPESVNSEQEEVEHILGDAKTLPHGQNQEEEIDMFNHDHGGDKLLDFFRNDSLQLAHFGPTVVLLGGVRSCGSTYPSPNPLLMLSFSQDLARLKDWNQYTEYQKKVIIRKLRIRNL